jgi:DNA-binding transcriptional ArsR family regulator
MIGAGDAGMVLDPLGAAPQVLFDLPLSELEAMWKSIDPWTPRHAEVADLVLRHRVHRAIRRRIDLSDARSLYDHIRRLVARSRLRKVDSPERTWTERWRGYADMLDTHVDALRTRDVNKALARAHAREILSFLSTHGDVPQKAIELRLGLGKANVSRVLGLLEAHELVERRLDGRQNRVTLGPAAEGHFEAEGRPFVPVPNEPVAPLHAVILQGAFAEVASDQALTVDDPGMVELVDMIGDKDAVG